MNKKLSNIPGMKQFALNVSHAETISNRICTQTCEWILKHGKRPSQKSKDTIEKKLGVWLLGQRQAKLGKGSYTPYSSNLAIANKYGLPNLFEQIDREKELNGICHECCKWILKHGKTPSTVSKDPIEKKLGNWLLNQKRTTYSSNLGIAKKYKLFNLFESKKYEKKYKLKQNKSLAIFVRLV